jgi:hypothetical protein
MNEDQNRREIACRMAGPNVQMKTILVLFRLVDPVYRVEPRRQLGWDRAGQCCISHTRPPGRRPRRREAPRTDGRLRVRHPSKRSYAFRLRPAQPPERRFDLKMRDLDHIHLKRHREPKSELALQPAGANSERRAQGCGAYLWRSLGALGVWSASGAHRRKLALANTLKPLVTVFLGDRRTSPRSRRTQASIEN